MELHYLVAALAPWLRNIRPEADRANCVTELMETVEAIMPGAPRAAPQAGNGSSSAQSAASPRSAATGIMLDLLPALRPWSSNPRATRSSHHTPEMPAIGPTVRNAHLQAFDRLLALIPAASDSAEQKIIADRLSMEVGHVYPVQARPDRLMRLAQAVRAIRDRDARSEAFSTVIDQIDCVFGGVRRDNCYFALVGHALAIDRDTMYYPNLISLCYHVPAGADVSRLANALQTTSDPCMLFHGFHALAHRMLRRPGTEDRAAAFDAMLDTFRRNRQRRSLAVAISAIWSPLQMLEPKEERDLANSALIAALGLHEHMNALALIQGAFLWWEAQFPHRDEPGTRGLLNNIHAILRVVNRPDMLANEVLARWEYLAREDGLGARYLDYLYSILDDGISPDITGRNIDSLVDLMRKLEADLHVDLFVCLCIRVMHSNDAPIAMRYCERLLVGLPRIPEDLSPGAISDLRPCPSRYYGQLKAAAARGARPDLTKLRGRVKCLVMLAVAAESMPDDKRRQLFKGLLKTANRLENRDNAALTCSLLLAANARKEERSRIAAGRVNGTGASMPKKRAMTH